MLASLGHSPIVKLKEKTTPVYRQNGSALSLAQKLRLGANWK